MGEEETDLGGVLAVYEATFWVRFVNGEDVAWRHGGLCGLEMGLEMRLEMTLRAYMMAVERGNRSRCQQTWYWYYTPKHG